MIDDERNGRPAQVIEYFGLAAGSYLAVLASVFAIQRRLIYVPDRNPADLGAAGLAGVMQEVLIRRADGGEVRSWYRPPATPDLPMVAYFQGNAGHIGDRPHKVMPFIAEGWGVLLVGFRGYGGNRGRPSEQGLYADARAALGYLDESAMGGGLVLYGESLGTAVAVQMAQERAALALVLEAPFTSIAAMAQRRFPIFPARWLVRDRFDSLAKIGALDLPVLVLHGERDAVTPAAFGRRVYEAATEPKALRLFPAAGHADLFEHGADRVAIEFVGATLGREPAG